MQTTIPIEGSSEFEVAAMARAAFGMALKSSGLTLDGLALDDLASVFLDDIE